MLVGNAFPFSHIEERQCVSPSGNGHLPQLLVGDLVQLFFQQQAPRPESTRLPFVRLYCEPSGAFRHLYCCGLEHAAGASAAHALGGKTKPSFQLSSNAAVKIDFQDSPVTWEGGLIVARKLDERSGFSELIEQHWADSRRDQDTRFPLPDPFRHSIYTELLS